MTTINALTASGHIPSGDASSTEIEQAQTMFPNSGLFPELELKILSYVHTKDLPAVHLVNSAWHNMASDSSLHTAYGLYKKYTSVFPKEFFYNTLEIKIDREDRGLRIIDEMPMIEKLEERLEALASFSTKKETVWQTHTLMELPAELTLRQLVYKPNGKKRSWIKIIDTKVLEQYGDTQLAKTQWVFITNTVIGRGKAFAKQKDDLIKELPGYELTGLVEATAANVAQFVRYGVYLYGEDPLTFTRCHQLVTYGQNSYQVAVGGFGAAGLDVDYCSCCDGDGFGLAAVLR